MDDTRNVPTSELDLNMQLTNAVWGRPEVSEELREALTQNINEVQEDGTILIKKRSLWGLFNTYTRDMRLAYLSEWNGEMQTCRYMLDLAFHYLNENMIEPFIIAMGMAVTIMETSQSKNGFLRKQMNTLIQKHETRNLDPPKKTFFGGGKRDTNGGY